MKFLDSVKVFLKSGHGGAGCVAFRREKFIEFGGPDGGDGGKGGDVIAEAVNHLNTLIDYRYHPHFKAGTGGHGMGKGRDGRRGADSILRLPVGTQIFEEDGETLIGDLLLPGERIVLARGGNGGFGNRHFVTAQNRAPRRANPGQEGEERVVWLRLKLIADIGLIGLPNAGKSSLLRLLTQAKPKVADYPFTTLYPHLGVLRWEDREYVLADIPGLIEGAHEGYGLGDRFLSHIERCSVLLHLVPADSENIPRNYRIIREELASYEVNLSDKPEIVLLSKTDLIPDGLKNEMFQELQEAVAKYGPKPLKEPVTQLKELGTGSEQALIPISTITRDGINTLQRALYGIDSERYRPSHAQEGGQWSPL